MSEAKSLNVLLIGASGGVGNALAKDLAAAGHRLMLHGFQSSERLTQLSKELSDAGFPVFSVEGDITKEADVEQIVASAEKELGGIDVLINNAGVSNNGVSWKLELSDWEQTLAVNLTGPFLTAKHTLRGMRERNWGRIINITSVVADTGVPGTAAYAASKAGLLGLTKTIAKETASKNISANCISLGYFNAGMLFTIPEEMRENIRKEIPRQAFGDTSAISECVLYLCKEASAYLTGQVLPLNGGLH